MSKRKIDKGFDGDSFLGKLFEMSSKVLAFTHEDVKPETGTISIDASDTSSNATATLALTLHPDTQERVYEKLRRTKILTSHQKRETN